MDLEVITFVGFCLHFSNFDVLLGFLVNFVSLAWVCSSYHGKEEEN